KWDLCDYRNKSVPPPSPGKGLWMRTGCSEYQRGLWGWDRQETCVELVMHMIYYAEQLLTPDGSLKSWKDSNNLQDLMNQTNYTVDFQEELYRQSKEELQQLDEASDEMEESEDYVSDVEGQTEGEWEAVAEVEEQYGVLERDLVQVQPDQSSDGNTSDTLESSEVERSESEKRQEIDISQQYLPRPRPAESEAARQKRKATFVEEEMRQYLHLDADQRRIKEEDINAALQLKEKTKEAE
ncbi:hypothetical protein BGZ54_004378, partial [Gamsiella multidivaricata]